MMFPWSKQSEHAASCRKPVVHVFLDCSLSDNPFEGLNAKIDSTMNRNNIFQYDTYLTYVVPDGPRQVSLGDAVGIAEVISSQTCSRKIIVPSPDPAFSSIIISHELGKCLMTTARDDCIIIFSNDKRIVHAAMATGSPTVKMLHITHDEEQEESTQREEPAEAPSDPTEHAEQSEIEADAAETGGQGAEGENVML